MEENVVLCAANSYKQKYYLNPVFDKLPSSIKDELKIMCVSYTEAAGGIISLEFDKLGDLKIKTLVDDNDFYFDEIESGLKISSFTRQKKELFEQLENFYKLYILKGKFNET